MDDERSPDEWERICRTQAALTADPKAKAFLLELADDYAELEAELARSRHPIPIAMRPAE